MPTTKIKAVLDVRSLPVSLFEDAPGRSRSASRTRKSVLWAIASWANPDGTNAYPSLKTITEACGLTERGLRKVIRWLEMNGFLDVEYKAGRNGTNKYAVIISEESRAVAQARYSLKNPTTGDPGRFDISARSTEDTPVQGIPGTLEHQTRNQTASHAELGTKHPELCTKDPEQAGSPNRPLDRPKEDRPIYRPEEPEHTLDFWKAIRQEETATDEEKAYLTAIDQGGISLVRFRAEAEAAGLSQRLARHVPLAVPLIWDSDEFNEGVMAYACDLLEDVTLPDVRLGFDYGTVCHLEANFGIGSSADLLEDICLCYKERWLRRTMWHEHAGELLDRLERARQDWLGNWEQYSIGETEQPPLDTVNLGIPRRPDDSQTSLAGSSPKHGREGLGLVI